MKIDCCKLIVEYCENILLRKVMKSIDNFYLQQDDPAKSCLLALREIILQQDHNITNELKYGMPFFCYEGKMFCYLWIHKKYKQPYLGIVEGKYFDDPGLIIEKRSRMKIMLFDVNKDLPIQSIKKIIQLALKICKEKIDR
jgi:hypothetical protein